MKLTDHLFFYPEKGMLDCNTYIIKGSNTIIIDVGSPQFLPALVKELNKDGFKPEDIQTIANTHLHGDHCGANATFKGMSGASIMLHPVQKQHYAVSVAETARFFGFPPPDFKEDGLFDKDAVDSDGEIKLIPAPGHSPDSICLYFKKDKTLICGDVLFEANTGRADLPGGSGSQLKQSIEALSQLDIEYLLPGHMGIIVGARKIKENFEFIKQHIFGWL